MAALFQSVSVSVRIGGEGEKGQENLTSIKSASFSPLAQPGGQAQVSRILEIKAANFQLFSSFYLIGGLSWPIH